MLKPLMVILEMLAGGHTNPNCIASRVAAKDYRYSHSIGPIYKSVTLRPPAHHTHHTHTPHTHVQHGLLYSSYTCHKQNSHIPHIPQTNQSSVLTYAHHTHISHVQSLTHDTQIPTTHAIHIILQIPQESVAQAIYTLVMLSHNKYILNPTTMNSQIYHALPLYTQHTHISCPPPPLQTHTPIIHPYNHRGITHPPHPTPTMNSHTQNDQCIQNFHIQQTAG